MESKSRKLIKMAVITISIMLIISVTSANVFGDVGRSASHKRSSTRTRSSTSGIGGGSRFFFFGGSGFGGGGEVVVVVVILVGCYIVYKNRSRFTRGGGAADVMGSLFGGNNGDDDDYDNDGRDYNPYNNRQKYNPEAALMAIKLADPNFSKAAFESRVSNMYMQLQEAWTKKQWRVARVFETDALFNIHARQLQDFIDTHTTNRVDNISVLQCELVRYEDDGANDAAYVLIKARINDYTIDDNTGKVISGNPKVDIYMTYMWELIRKKGVLTKNDGKASQATQCPNCGANVSVNESGECEYCGGLVTSGQYDWVLASIEVVDQRND